MNLLEFTLREVIEIKYFSYDYFIFRDKQLCNYLAECLYFFSIGNFRNTTFFYQEDNVSLNIKLENLYIMNVQRLQIHQIIQVTLNESNRTQNSARLIKVEKLKIIITLYSFHEPSKNRIPYTYRIKALESNLTLVIWSST